ncbi:MAG: radical SAM protein [Anaerolineae bacterium]
MRIKLVFPGRKMRNLEIRGKNHLVPSETLATLAAVTPPQHEVVIEDENVRRLHLDDQPDVVGITVYTFLVWRAYEIADHYRAKGVYVVLGGLHVTGRPEEALTHADTVVVGEGDSVWPQFLADFEAGHPKPMYRADEAVPLDALPLPRKDLLDARRYLSTASVSATRGCPYHCQYCFNSVDGASPFRKRSIHSIIRQIEAMRDTGQRYIIFFDDNLTVDRKFARALCEALKGVGVRWRCAASIEVAYDEELLQLMAESGCESLFIGLESVNSRSLVESSKTQNRVRDYEQLIHAIKRHGIMINASFVFGFDHDDPTVFQETLDFAVRNKLDSINFHILTPYPGTVLFKRLEAEGRILTYDWDQYDTAHVVFRPARMTIEELERGYVWIYKKFYSWPNILRRIPDSPLEQKIRFLVFNIALKKANWAWEILIRLKLLFPLFRTYWRLLGTSRPIAPPQRRSVHTLTAARGSEGT